MPETDDMKSLTGGQYSEIETIQVFAQPFPDGGNSGTYDISDIESMGDGEGSTVPAGFYTAERFELGSQSSNSEDRMEIEDLVVLCASEEIEIHDNVVIDGRGNGSEGGEHTSTELSLDGDDRGVDVDLPSRDDIYSGGNPPWEQQNRASEHPVHDDRVMGNPPDWLIDSDIERDTGRVGMFGEGGWFDGTDWLEQLYLLVLAEEVVGISREFSLRGGRGGPGGVIEDDIDLTDIEGQTGGDGGASFVVMAPRITITQEATVDLRGIRPTDNGEDNGDVTIPANRGMSGNFGFVTGDTEQYASSVDVSTSNIHTHGRVSGVKIDTDV